MQVLLGSTSVSRSQLVHLHRLLGSRWWRRGPVLVRVRHNGALPTAWLTILLRHSGVRHNGPDEDADVDWRSAGGARPLLCLESSGCLVHRSGDWPVPTGGGARYRRYCIHTAELVHTSTARYALPLPQPVGRCEDPAPPPPPPAPAAAAPSSSPGRRPPVGPLSAVIRRPSPALNSPVTSL